MPEERLTADELEYLCFGANGRRRRRDLRRRARRGGDADPAVRRARRGLARARRRASRPSRRTGCGKELVARGGRPRRASSARTTCCSRARSRATSGPASTSRTRAPGCCSRRCGFERDWVGTNMAIDTSFRRPPPAGVVVERETGAGAHDFAAAAYPALGSRARPRGRCSAPRSRRATRDGRTIGFACHSVNRVGWIGPMATDPTLQHGGVGSAVARRAVRRPRAARLRDRRDLLGQQPALLRQVRRPRLARVPRRAVRTVRREAGRRARGGARSRR